MDNLYCYTYDAENRLLSVAPETAPGSGVCGATTMNYLYDPEGRRVARLQNGSIVKQYYYDAAGHMITEADASANTLRAEIYAGARHLATWTGNATYFNHADWLGTERARSDSSGSRCESISSLPFGDGAVTTGTCTPTPTFFTGLERDAESGLDHALNRQYPSNLGRWLTPGPAGKKAVKLEDPQTWDMYAYARNNPTTLTDPSGLFVQCSAGLSNKDMKTCLAIQDAAYEKAKNGNYKYQKLHDIYTTLNDDKHVWTIENVALKGAAVGKTILEGPNSEGTDFRSGTIQIDFNKLKGMTSPSPADKVPGFNMFAGIIGKKTLEVIENFGHEGAHGVWTLNNMRLAVTMQNLINITSPMHWNNPQFLPLGFVKDQILNLSETYAQQQEQIVNRELIDNPQ